MESFSIKIFENLILVFLKSKELNNLELELLHEAITKKSNNRFNVFDIT